MTIQDLPQSDWCSFLESFSRRHRAWLGTLHGLDGATITRIPAVALKSVALETGATGSVLRLAFLSGLSFCAVRPCVVRVQTDDGAERALEAETVDGGFIRLAFRASPLPEQLDGVSPGELIAQAST